MPRVLLSIAICSDWNKNGIKEQLVDYWCKTSWFGVGVDRGDMIKMKYQRVVRWFRRR